MFTFSFTKEGTIHKLENGNTLTEFRGISQKMNKFEYDTNPQYQMFGYINFMF